MVMGSCLGFETPCDLSIPVSRSLSFVGSSRPLSECSSSILARYTSIALYETWQAMKQQKYRKVSDEARSILGAKLLESPHSSLVGMRPWSLPTHRETPNDGHVLIVELLITFLRTAHSRLFVTACNTIDHLIADHPDLQYVGTLTIDSAQETNAISSISIFVLQGPPSSYGSPTQIGGHPTNTSEGQFMP